MDRARPDDDEKARILALEDRADRVASGENRFSGSVGQRQPLLHFFGRRNLDHRLDVHVVEQRFQRTAAHVHLAKPTPRGEKWGRTLLLRPAEMGSVSTFQ
jgi:hypothetical protein